MNNEQKLCKVNISSPIYLEFYEMCQCIQEFWYIMSGLDIQPDQSENENPARKKSDSRLRETTIHVPFFSPNW